MVGEGWWWWVVVAMAWVVVGGQYCTRRTLRRPGPDHGDTGTYHGRGGASRPRFMLPERAEVAQTIISRSTSISARETFQPFAFEGTATSVPRPAWRAHAYACLLESHSCHALRARPLRPGGWGRISRSDMT